LFENNLLAVDKYLATINTADGKMGVGEHYLSQIWCRRAALLSASRRVVAARLYAHMIQIHAQFFVQILVVKLIAQILCTFSSPRMHMQHSYDTRIYERRAYTSISEQRSHSCRRRSKNLEDEVEKWSKNTFSGSG